MKKITWEFIDDFKKEIEASEFVLFNTGWGDFWGTDKYYQNYPVLDKDSATYLTTFLIKGIGIDTPSPDPVNSETWDIHKILFTEDIIIIENLFFPEMEDVVTGEFYGFPLNIKEADGSPVRAVLKVE